MKSQTYTVSRYMLMRLSAEEYVRRFWWFVAIFPSFGLTAMIFGSGLLQVIGLMAFFWPFSIPARGILASSRAAKALMRGVWILVEGDALYFHDSAGSGFRLPMEIVSNLVTRQGYWVLRLKNRHGVGPIGIRLGDFIPISPAAFGEEAPGFLVWVQDQLSARLVESEA